ncbi:hypothetical protein ACFORG_20945 [Lutimaribacter marinistellae]|uniref:Glycosyltransferase like family protein n=1 Tax=Lutimaribacter marinistellae TaxID=1820329 RepID=A0ABV7TKP1_9RHOB
MTGVQARYVTEERQPELLFSVCTLVASDDRYKRLLESFERFGFTSETTEFIALDNRGQNRFDGYSALRRMFPEFRGRYIVMVHDDVELVDDGAEELQTLLELLDRQDPQWTLAGCAGWSADGTELLRHLRDPHGSSRPLTAPREAQSLDECFLVLPRARAVLPSLDLEGFHLYATDMCVQARMAGGRTYVLPFFVHHHSGGTHGPDLEASRDAFTRKYEALDLGTRLRAPAVTVYFGAMGGMRRWLDETGARLRHKTRMIASRAGVQNQK